MKIGIDISQIVYEGTGTSVYFKNLVQWLPRLNSKDKYVFFGSSLRRQKQLRPFTNKIFPFPPSALDFFWNRLHIFPVDNLIGKIDIFHSSDWTQPPTRAKKVAPILDLLVYKFPQSLHSQIVATQKRRLQWVKREADKIITISQSTRKDIIDILGIPEKKIGVTYLAAGEEFKLQPLPRSDYILTMGSVTNKRKNVSNVIAACQKINVPLKIIDGSIAQKDLPNLYAQAKCFVYASSYEGFGIPILEAMACGTPVICGKNSSMPEVAGEAATYADVESVDDLAEKISGIKKTGLEISQAKKFSWEKTAKETLKIYEELG